jgi:hypothetical protein
MRLLPATSADIEESKLCSGCSTPGEQLIFEGLSPLGGPVFQADNREVSSAQDDLEGFCAALAAKTRRREGEAP